MTYGDAILQFFYQEFPELPAAPEVRFEAVSAEVFGTKQRRLGPMPPPEAQVAVRDVLRASPALVRFFVPWGSRKQADGRPLDVLEFCALKQLRCLKDGLARYGLASDFTFRLEDLTDRYLFGEAGRDQQAEYVRDFHVLARAILPGADVRLESRRVAGDDFFAHAERVAPVFNRYLLGETGPETLAAIGWQGDIPKAQSQFYLDAYRALWPGREPVWELARYFAATSARFALGAAGLPGTPYVCVSFTHPVPGNPVARPRVYYRTVPARYTHLHRAAWLGLGYLEVADDGTCTPKVAGPYELPADCVANAVRWADVDIAAPYREPTE
jgi:hypothetical protein